MVRIKGSKLLCELVVQMATKLLNGPPHYGLATARAQDSPKQWQSPTSHPGKLQQLQVSVMQSGHLSLPPCPGWALLAPWV